LPREYIGSDCLVNRKSNRADIFCAGVVAVWEEPFVFPTLEDGLAWDTSAPCATGEIGVVPKAPEACGLPENRDSALEFAPYVPSPATVKAFSIAPRQGNSGAAHWRSHRKCGEKGRYSCGQSSSLVEIDWRCRGWLPWMRGMVLVAGGLLVLLPMGVRGLLKPKWHRTAGREEYQMEAFCGN
jgi:hypothetical protein